LRERGPQIPSAGPARSPSSISACCTGVASAGCERSSNRSATREIVAGGFPISFGVPGGGGVMEPVGRFGKGTGTSGPPMPPGLRASGFVGGGVAADCNGLSPEIPGLGTCGTGTGMSGPPCRPESGNHYLRPREDLRASLALVAVPRASLVEVLLAAPFQ
jgi:hypothetical protein